MVANVIEMPLSDYRKLVIQIIKDLIADGTLEVREDGIIDLCGE